MSRAPVLIVDDDHDIVEAMRSVLAAAGHSVLLATSAKEALEQLSAPPLPGLILLDLMLPGMDGWQLHTELSKNPALAAVPVVLMSGGGAVVQAAQTLAVAGCLKKPFRLEELLETVERFCRTASALEAQPG